MVQDWIKEGMDVTDKGKGLDVTETGFESWHYYSVAVLLYWRRVLCQLAHKKKKERTLRTLTISLRLCL